MKIMTYRFKKITQWSCLMLSVMMLISGENSAIYAKETSSSILYPVEIAMVGGDYYGYINKEGEWIVPPGYTTAYPFTAGLGVVEQDGKYGIINSKGKEVLKPTYESISPYQEKRASFEVAEGMGVLNEKGKAITSKYYQYIGSYTEGLAVVSENKGSDQTLYGYIGLDGKEVISPQYLQAEDFIGDQALVKKADSSYALINKKGETITTFKENYVYGYNDNAVIFNKKTGDKVGYMDGQGKVIIPTKYNSGEVFHEGVAIVSTGEYFWGEKSLIDKVDKAIYPNVYNDMIYLGEGRVALGKAIDTKEPLKGSIYAIGDTAGKVLTDYIYYGVAPYKDGVASAYDAKQTFFIDKEGNKLTQLPTLGGSGTLSQEDGIVVAKVDYQTSYLTPEGKIIGEPNDKIPLNEAQIIDVEKYKPNVNYLVYYPQIEGIKDQTAMNTINTKLKNDITQGGVNEQDSGIYTYYSKFEVPFYKQDLVVIDSLASTYYFGAAHPMPSRTTYNIDLNTGEVYALSDLFKKDSNWKGELEKIMQDMAKNHPKYANLFKDTPITIEPNQGFWVDDEAVNIYYPPYDIGPYSEGYVTFRIPYEQIDTLINKEGSFWKAYH